MRSLSQAQSYNPWRNTEDDQCATQGVEAQRMKCHPRVKAGIHSRSFWFFSAATQAVRRGDLSRRSPMRLRSEPTLGEAERGRLEDG